MAVDFLDEKRNEIVGRLEELRPLVAEYHRLEAAVAALDGVAPSPTSQRPGRRSPARSTPARKTNSSAHPRGRGRPVGSGKRGAEALTIVTSNPGITIAEIAVKMGINQNYLYRVLPGLADDGLVIKQGRGWHPAPPSDEQSAGT